MRFISSKFAALLLSLVALVGMAPAQQKTNPLSQINWPLLSGNGTPNSLGIPCTATNYTQPYQDTSQNPNVYYSCGSHGWQTLQGAQGVAGPAGGPQQYTLLGLPAASSYPNLLITLTDSTAPGTCSPATVNVLNGPITSGQTTLTLTTATTSAWGSTGYLKLDSEVVQYSGVSSGLTTITIARGQNSTTAASHSSGVLVYMVGGGSYKVSCVSDGTNWNPVNNGAPQSQVNVQNYGAKGDCSTDDTAAFTAAQNAAFSYNGLPASLYIPKGSGSCYIVSDFVWKGAPLVGQFSGLAGAGTGSGNIILKSKPGHDVLKVPDPSLTTGTVTLQAGWQIRNVTLQVDNSIAPVNSTYHRWPGRWVDDANVTASSNVITESSGIFTCGDVNQQITIGGAGATATTDTLGAAITSTSAKTITLTTGLNGSWPTVFAYVKVDSEIMLVEVQGLTNGTVTFTNVQRGQAGTTAATHSNGASVTVMGNLTTTIASVYPCWNSPTTKTFNSVTLAANATTTMTNAHAYISILGLPVTENIGNCDIAMDIYDGNSADWTATTAGGNYGKMENVLFETTSGTNNDSCGIFTQGNPYLYGLTVNNFAFYGMKFGVVSGATSEINPGSQSDGNDYMHWSDGLMFFPWEPWIQYNGLSDTIDNMQITAFAGPQFLQAPAAAFESLGGLHVKNSGFETPYSPTAYGWRVEGSGHAFDGVSLNSFTAGQYAYWDASSSTCSCGGTQIYLNGYGNTFQTSQGAIIGGSYYNNTAYYNYVGNPLNGYPAAYNVSAVPAKGTVNLAGRFTGDFGFDNNPSVNYTHDDLVLWPQDMMITASLWPTHIVQDSTSPSGYYILMDGSVGGIRQFLPWVARGITGSSLIGGTALPLNGITINFQAKCASTTTFQLSAGYFGGSASTQTFNCTTSYANYSMNIGFKSSDSGKFFQLSANSTTWQASYFVLTPWHGSYNYFQPVVGNNEVVLNFSNWPSWNNVPFTTDANSPYGAVVGNWGSNSSYIITTPGVNYPAVPSKISYWVGGASAFSDTLGASAASGDTTLTLASATTSAWGSAGYILIDGELLHYSGVTTGLTSVSVTRGQYGTVAAAHANGASMIQVGVGTMSVICNSTTVSSVNVYFSPTYQTFTAPFPAQQCAGYQTNLASLSNNSGETSPNYFTAQVKITPDEEWLNVPTAANQVPVSVSKNGMYQYNGNIPLAGSGAGLTTGPTSGTVNNHIAVFGGTDGHVVDSGLTVVARASTGSIGGSALTAGQCTTGTASITGAVTSGTAYASPVSDPGTGFSWSAFISSSNTITVRVCAVAAGTPTATIYQVTYQP